MFKEYYNLTIRQTLETWTVMEIVIGLLGLAGDPCADGPRAVSRESVAYLQQLRKNTPFGTTGFDLAALRAGMGSRREPTSKGIQLIRVTIGDIPCEWVLAPGADPDVRLLYLHGGGFVSGSGGFYLTLAARLSAAARCAVLLPDYRLAPEHPFPAGLRIVSRPPMMVQRRAPDRLALSLPAIRPAQLDFGDRRAPEPQPPLRGNRPVTDHRLDPGERFAANGQRSHHQCTNHARVPETLSG
jgi:hypothetical protein